MALPFGIFVIVTLISLKIFSFTFNRLKNSTSFKNLTDYGTFDKVNLVINIDLPNNPIYLIRDCRRD